MKSLLATLSLFLCGVASQAPYPASGWRPSGPSFELPERQPAGQIPQNFPLDPRSKTPIKQEYLPPQQYGAPANPDVDLSVQGLPQQEQVPVFQLSPINGQQYVGPNFNSDVRNLDQSLRQSQVQNQQEIYRQLTRQRQLEAAQSNTNQNGIPAPQSPRQFAGTTAKPQTRATTVNPDERSSESATGISLNEGETLDNSNNTNRKVTVEVTKQNIQEFPAELYLNPLAQLSLQPQLIPVQFGQIRAYPEQSQKQVGYDAQTHFAALPSVLAQQRITQVEPALLAQQQIQQYQLQQQQLAQQQFLGQQQQDQDYKTLLTPSVSAQQQIDQQYYQQLAEQQLVQQQLTQQQFYQQQQYLPSQSQQPIQPQAVPVQPQLIPQGQGQQPSYLVPRQEPGYVQVGQQPGGQYDPNQIQIQAQPVLIPQPNQAGQSEGVQPQFVYQYQPQYTQEQLYQQQILQSQGQGQNNLQSGLNANQPGRNDIDQPEDAEDDGVTVTAVATAFGTRTQPRVNTRYGVPEQVPRVQPRPGYPTTTEAADEAVTEDSQAVEAARVSQRKNAKLRTRRVRPVFTLDKSGHLVLSQDQ